MQYLFLFGKTYYCLFSVCIYMWRINLEKATINMNFKSY